MSNTKKRRQTNKTPQKTAPSPWPRRLLIAAGVGAAGLIVAVIALSQPPPRGVPEGTETIAVGAPQHVEGDIHDDDDIPAGGAHSAVWQNCGFYDAPIRSENAVHSLEHGAVWITYDPNLDASEIEQLRALPKPGEKVLISPVPDQPAPIIATAWANQLELTTTDDTRLEQFINEFERSPDAPEPGGSCVGGVGSPLE